MTQNSALIGEIFSRETTGKNDGISKQTKSMTSLKSTNRQHQTKITKVFVHQQWTCIRKHFITKSSRKKKPIIIRSSERRKTFQNALSILEQIPKNLHTKNKHSNDSIKMQLIFGKDANNVSTLCKTKLRNRILNYLSYHKSTHAVDR